MSDLPTIAGVDLKTYAELCAAMADTAGDETKELAIARAAGVGESAWRAAKAGFTARMSDPADAGKTAMAFMPFYQAAQAKARGGAEPCAIEVYARISAEYSFEKDASGKQVAPEVVFARHGINGAKWNEYTSYWTPKVNDPADPAAGRFRVLMQAESDRIFGIVREGSPPAAPASPPPRPRAPLAAAPTLMPDLDDIAPTRPATPVQIGPRPAAPPPVPAAAPPPRPAGPPPVPAASAPPPARPAAPPPVPSTAASAPPPVPASTAPARPAPPPPPAPPPAASSSADPTVVPGLTDDERLWAALAHALVIPGLAILAPLVIWVLYKEPEKSAYVRWHAFEALKVQIGLFVVVMVLGMVTCGVGTVLIVPWFALEAWVAWLAWQGKREGYPMLPGFPG